MAIEGIPPRVTTSEIEPVVAQRRPAGPGATPALQSSSGLMGRGGVPPDANRRRATVPTMAAAQAGVRLDQGASTSTFSLRDLFRMEDEQDRRTLERHGGRRLDDHTGKGSVSRAMEGLAAPDALPSSPAGPAGAQPVAGDASGGTAEPAAPGPRLTRSLHGRHHADSLLHAVADQWQIESSPGAHMAGPSDAGAAAGVADGPASKGAGVTRSPGGRLGAESTPGAMAGQLQAEDSQPSPAAGPAHQPRQFWESPEPLLPIPEEPRVRFAAAEQRTFDPAGKSTVLGKRVQIALAGAGGARASRTGVASIASKSAEREKDLGKDAVFALNNAFGRLQALAILDPERARQAIEKRVLPAEVLGESLGTEFTKELLDLHAQIQEGEVDKAAGRWGHGFKEMFGTAAGDVAKVREDTLRRAAMEAQMGGALPTPELNELTPDQLAKVTGALKGRGQALQRMMERAARASPKTLLDRARRAVQHQPRALEGARHKDFVALVDRDIAALVTKLSIEPRHAARLLQRAVDKGQMGADTLRPQDRALLLEVLAAKASNGGG